MTIYMNIGSNEVRNGVVPGRWCVLWTTSGAVEHQMVSWFPSEEEALTFARGKSVGADGSCTVCYVCHVMTPTEAPPLKHVQAPRAAEQERTVTHDAAAFTVADFVDGKPYPCPRCRQPLLPPYKSTDGKHLLRDCSRCFVAYEPRDASDNLVKERLKQP